MWRMELATRCLHLWIDQDAENIASLWSTIGLDFIGLIGIDIIALRYWCFLHYI